MRKIQGILIDTSGNCSVKEFQEPLYQSMGEAVGGFFEVVRCLPNLPEGVCMVCNEEGRLRGLNTNAIASLLYHYTYIVGDIVLIKEGFYNGEMDFVSLSDEEIIMILGYIKGLIAFFSFSSSLM